jgi:hypothetical protein
LSEDKGKGKGKIILCSVKYARRNGHMWKSEGMAPVFLTSALDVDVDEFHPLTASPSVLR